MIIKSTFAILTRPDRLQSLIGQLRSRYASDRVHPGILLVEGINDVGTFKAFLAKVPGSRKPTKDQEFLILPLGGNTLVNGSRGEVGKMSDEDVEEFLSTGILGRLAVNAGDG